MAFASRTSCGRERAARRHVQDVPRPEPADRQHRRIVGRLDRQASVRRQRRNRLGLERGAPEELPQRGLQEIIVERASRKDRRKRHEVLDHNSSRMPRRTLIDFFDDLAAIDGEFLVYDDGYRTWSLTYAEVADAARAFAAPPSRRRHRQRPVGRHLEREPPRVDRRALGMPARRRRPRPHRLPHVGRLSPPRSPSIVTARAILVGDVVDTASARRFCAPRVAAGRAQIAVAPLTRRWLAPPMPTVESVARATDADCGRHRRDHLHLGRHRRPQGRRHHPSEHPREHRPDREGSREVPPVGQAVPPDPLPQPAAAQPHVRPGDGHVRAADAAGPRRSSRAASLPTTSSGRSASAACRCSCACPRSSRSCAITSSASRPRRPSRRPKMHWTTRWWRYRRVHRLFGFKFWAIVVGAAPLDPELEAFWGRLGFVVDPGLRPDRDGADRHAESSVPRRARRRRQADRRRRDPDCGRRRDPRAGRERHARVLQRAGGDAHGVPGRLVPHRRRRRNRRHGTAAHPRPQEGNDRHRRRASTSSPKTSSKRSMRSLACANRRSSARSAAGSTAERVHAVARARTGRRR